MFLRQRVIASLLGLIVALGGLIVELVALPMARFGEPLFTYTAEKAPFGLPASVSIGVAFVAGLVTYNTGVVPDHAAETPWLVLADVAVYGGAVALLVALVLAIVMAGGSREASKSP